MLWIARNPFKLSETDRENYRHWEKDFHLRKLKLSASTLVPQITVGILLKIFILKAIATDDRQS